MGPVPCPLSWEAGISIAFTVLFVNQTREKSNWEENVQLWKTLFIL